MLSKQNVFNKEVENTNATLEPMVTPEVSVNMPTVDSAMVQPMLDSMPNTMVNPTPQPSVSVSTNSDIQDEEVAQNNAQIDIESLKKMVNDCYDGMNKNLENLKQIKDQLEKFSGINKSGNDINLNQDVSLGTAGEPTELNNQTMSAAMPEEPKLVDPLLNDAMAQIQNMPMDSVQPSIEPAVASQGISSSIPALEPQLSGPPVIDEAPIQPSF